MKMITLIGCFLIFAIRSFAIYPNTSIGKLCYTDFIKYDSSSAQVHPLVKKLFYMLPLEMRSEDLKDVLLNDGRFISSGHLDNAQQPSFIYKGVTSERGVVGSNPDSIQVALVLGNTLLKVAKGGEAEFKDILLLNCKYFFSYKDSMLNEYEKLVGILSSIIVDSTAEHSALPYAYDGESGQMLINGKIFESYSPYYRVGLSSISMVPDGDAKSYYVLEIVFGKED